MDYQFFRWNTVATIVLFGTTAALAVLPHMFVSHDNAITIIAGTALPMGIIGCYLLGGVYVASQNISSNDLLTVTAWSSGIAIVTGGIAGVSFSYLNLRGMRIGPATMGVAIANSGGAGALLGLLLGWMSVTRRQTEGRLARERERVEQLNTRLVVLNRVLRHDIRNDVNVIMGYLEFLNKGKVTVEEALDLLYPKIDEINNLSERARDIEQLIAEEEVTRKPIDLIPMIEREIEELADPRDDIETDLEAPERALVKASPMLESAIDNLLENAVNHNDKETVRISVCVDCQPQCIQCSIQDNGPGIPEYERTLLEKQSESDLHHSDGLGLWLVNWIVEESEGDIDIETCPDGSTVRLTLPRAYPESQEATVQQGLTA